MTKRCYARSIPTGLLGVAALVGLSAPAIAQSRPAAGQPPLMDREKEIALALSARRRWRAKRRCTSSTSWAMSKLETVRTISRLSSSTRFPPPRSRNAWTRKARAHCCRASSRWPSCALKESPPHVMFYAPYLTERGPRITKSHLAGLCRRFRHAQCFDYRSSTRSGVGRVGTRAPLIFLKRR
jgi:hypothetical protein